MSAAIYWQDKDGVVADLRQRLADREREGAVAVQILQDKLEAAEALIEQLGPILSRMEIADNEAAHDELYQVKITREAWRMYFLEPLRAALAAWRERHKS